MHCDQCGTRNRNEARFCSACGAALVSAPGWAEPVGLSRQQLVAAETLPTGVTSQRAPRPLANNVWLVLFTLLCLALVPAWYKFVWEAFLRWIDPRFGFQSVQVLDSAIVAGWIGILGCWFVAVLLELDCRRQVATLSIRPPRDAARRAGFWLRLGAFWLDVLILVAIRFSLAVLIGLVAYLLDPGMPQRHVEMIARLLAILATIAYVAYSWTTSGRTLGKRMLGLAVVDDSGLPNGISYHQALARLIGYAANFCTLYIGFLWVIWDKNKQGFHDKFAGTHVIEL